MTVMMQSVNGSVKLSYGEHPSASSIHTKVTNLIDAYTVVDVSQINLLTKAIFISVRCKQCGIDLLIPSV